MSESRAGLLALILAVGCAGAGESLLAESVAPAPESSGSRSPESESPAAESPGAGVPVAELLPNAVSLEDGLLAGGQPTIEQLGALRDAGYVTVINLRTDAEGGTGRTEVEGMGMTYVALPIAGAEDLSEANARSLAAVLEDVERPAVVHCGSGNRVGALFALKAYYVDGWSPEEAIQLGQEAGLTRLEGALREHLQSADAGPAPQH